MDPNRTIFRKFHIKHGDNLPFVGFLDYTRQDLPELFNELGYKTGAEIGVQRGHFSRALCDGIPGLKLICVDPWCAYGRSVTEHRAEQRLAEATDRLMNCDATFMRMTSMEAVKQIPDYSLDFVYIDGLHEFDPVMMDLISWVPKVRSGGIVAGHDYLHYFQGGVVEAVNAYTRAHHITQWYITKEYLASFYWVNT